MSQKLDPLHVWPQLPQFWSSVSAFAQVDPQHTPAVSLVRAHGFWAELRSHVVVRHALPSTHMVPEPHGFVVEQSWPHVSVPASSEHTPPGGQMLPHPLQFSVSDWKLWAERHAPGPQQVPIPPSSRQGEPGAAVAQSWGGVVHCPLTQISPAKPHGVLQNEQLLGSVSMSAHVPPQHMPVSVAETKQY